jgi:sugar transferase (PEP-CTERM/EpsH1 system associated)
MNGLLLLVHRLPFPPDKGDKIRSYHLLRALSRRYRVRLGTFVDDERDWQHVPEVRRLCEDAYFAKLDRKRATLRSLTGLLTGEPLTLPFYRDEGLARWTERQLADEVRHIVVFSSSMAQYAMAGRAGECRRVIDFCDVDSDKWRQYATSAGWPRTMLYRREADRLLAAERAIAARFDASIFVSRLEADLFRKLAPESAGRVHVVANGVDLDYFDPTREYPTPFPAGARPVVFTGAMDYRANVDAVRWFASEVWPRIREVEPSAVFYIVGRGPTPEVRALAELPNVVVTGGVPDVRPYLKWAQVSVAPLRIARGVQNKVLEALAMSRPIVATSHALQGIEPRPVPNAQVADDAGRFAEIVCALLKAREEAGLGREAREFVERAFDWTTNLDQLLEWVELDDDRRPAAEVRREAASPCV